MPTGNHTNKYIKYTRTRLRAHQPVQPCTGYHPVPTLHGIASRTKVARDPIPYQGCMGYHPVPYMNGELTRPNTGRVHTIASRPRTYKTIAAYSYQYLPLKKKTMPSWCTTGCPKLSQPHKDQKPRQ